MSDTDEDSVYDKFDKDPRILCKYGIECYQKNPSHHQKYKHPPQTSEKETRHTVKKLKTDTEEQQKITKIDSDTDNDDDDNEIATVSINNDVSDSDSSDTEKSGSEPNNSIEKMQTEPSVSETKPDIPKIENHKYNLEREFIKEKFLVTMPEDFYQFWDFCKRLKPDKPQDAFTNIGLTLVGPFDVLAGKFKNSSKPKEEYLVHWRYYRDPPEFQTVLKGDNKTGYHIGYFRDSPEELPSLLCSNSVNKDGVLTAMGGNIFAALHFYLEDLKKFGDPFKKMHIGKVESQLNKEVDSLKLEMSRKTSQMIAREKKIVTRTFNKIGLVVPFDKKTDVGYRELAFNNKDLNILLTKLQNLKGSDKTKYLAELQPVFTFANIATDECDFGTGLELGLDLISHGVDCLDSTISDFLVTNYNLLNRGAFAKIAAAHMKNRKKGCDLSIL